ncbi:hypothetical protein POM88_045864 [Heracleum sosnowskyi]|uniref:Uncharacterized protein n=1 Tax=Heracleum sosnowskyi TaxID=360622 RepID=A0AAD8H877_9APIA|nr:hypothetical protein POM88_045864 [Heracleum sosnowskyi]
MDVISRQVIKNQGTKLLCIKKAGSEGTARVSEKLLSISTTDAMVDNYLASLTEKIRDQIAQEMDEKVEKKVRENVKMMMSKLEEKCPELKVDIEELSVAPPNSVQDGDASGADNDTPLCLVLLL